MPEDAGTAKPGKTTEKKTVFRLLLPRDPGLRRLRAGREPRRLRGHNQHAQMSNGFSHVKLKPRHNFSPLLVFPSFTGETQTLELHKSL